MRPSEFSDGNKYRGIVHPVERQIRFNEAVGILRRKPAPVPAVPAVCPVLLQ